MVTYQQELEKTIFKKKNRPKKTNYIPGEPKERNKVIFKKKMAPKIYCNIPAAPKKNNFKKNQYQNKRITYHPNLKKQIK